jgi:hypothetical protein
MRRRLPVDVVARGETGRALVVDERNRMGWVRLTPWFANEPWRSAALDPALDPALEAAPGDAGDPGRRAGPKPHVPAPGPGRDVGIGGL